ncbi:MAG: hypothetical protein A2096_16800 [Spirochaetes bacterium GWF1_41_5]|nr:MAG: hypothetical protein A2096_16800 [Spirochaetes bacterium GWF1_41_5]HBE03827.1 hypothetical protein [Spirochaetia bacterium]
MLIEGKTEKVFLPVFRNFLAGRLTGRMPKLDPLIYDGRISSRINFAGIVENLLKSSNRLTNRAEKRYQTVRIHIKKRVSTRIVKFKI